MKDNPGYSTGRTAAGDTAVIGNGNGPIGISSTRALRDPALKSIIKIWVTALSRRCRVMVNQNQESQVHKPKATGGWARRAQAIRRQAIRGSTSVECGPNHSLRGKVSLDGPLADRGARYSHKVLWLRERHLGAG